MRCVVPSGAECRMLFWGVRGVGALGKEGSLVKRGSRYVLLLLAAVSWLTLTGLPCVSLAVDGPPDFVRDIQPILVNHCYPCHSGEAAESGFRLDIKSEAFRGGDGYGIAIVPGDAAASPLVRFVRSVDARLRMPPVDADTPALNSEQQTLLAAWVDAGAMWPDDVDTASLVDRLDHWSFHRVRPPEVLSIAEDGWSRNGVDRFIKVRLDEAGIKPSPEADRRAWLRRVTLDLIGLPPTPEELHAFLNDAAPSAYERVVERLLASPRYGERYAQHWLDIVRYADTHGYEVNTERPNAWPYRDWVIEAFHTDMPYDRFVREQLAGDAYGADAATGFLVTAAVLLPGQIGADEASKRQARQEALADIIINVSDTFLGLSIGCARCHDHKFDPVSQRDYYALQAFLSGIRYEDRPLHTPAADAARDRIAQLQAGKAAAEAELTALGEKPSDDTAAAEQFAGQRAALEKAIAEYQQQIAVESDRTRVFAGSFHQPDQVSLLARGDPEQPGEQILPQTPLAFERRLPAVAFAAGAAEQTRRLALANWIVDPEHPLTARVMVNRLWQWHFGTGLVESASDFGRNGAPPSHPQLLDWLASRFVQSGWSMKEMHRLIVLSSTYRQASEPFQAAAAAVDAECRLLWRFPSRRLEAEVIRDSMLAVSGRLNLEMGGPGFDLFKSRGGLSGFPPVERFGPEGRRRMVYAHKIRMEKASVFGAFDCPDAGQTLEKRQRSTTPIQALNLFNSPFTIDESAAFAERVVAEAAATTEGDAATLLDQQVERAFFLALARSPDDVERADSLTVVAEHGIESLCRALLNSNEFLFLP
jgi:hypothetical protein